MSLDPRFICTSDVDTYYVDKDTGLPLAAGIITFYSDKSRTILKSVYQLTGSAGSYNYAPLPDPCILSMSGTFQDAMGNNIVPYYFPYFCTIDGDPSTSTGMQELYYITVESSGHIQQLTRQAWPPSAVGSGNSGNDVENYIPNGQFLAYNSGDAANVTALTLTGLGNIDERHIAQGGWSFNRTTGGTGVYTTVFNALDEGITTTNDYPHAELVFGCSSVGTDTVRDIQIRWPDVFKFSAEDGGDQLQTFTFFIATQTRDTLEHDFDLRLISYYGSGGTPSTNTDISIGKVSFSSVYGYQTISVTFPDNSGMTKGTNGDDYVAISLRAPQTTFNVAMTDAGLVLGSESITTYPLKTNASMLSEGIAGWMPTPDPLGNDLYLPLVLTPNGMTFDNSKIGNIESSILSASSKANQPQLYCDGSSYLYNKNSSLGIPYSRLGSILISDSPVLNIPKFGTGANFVNSYISAGNTAVIRITANTPGALTAAADGTGMGATGWTIGSIYTGEASVGFTAFNNIANTVLVVGNFLTAASASSAGTSPFTVADNNPNTGYTAQYKYSFEITATIVSSGNAGSYIAFSNASTNYYLWFKVDGAGSDPVPGGKTSIGFLNLLSTYTAQDIANCLREAMNQFQISTVVVSAAPTASKYFTFYGNPSVPAQYAVWYSVDTVGVAPTGVGTPIKVSVLSTNTAAEVALATQVAINSYQYAIPDFRGMFLRGLDPNGTWDLDILNRWATVSGMSGANVGTFEFQQFLSHSHNAILSIDTNSAGGSGTAVYSPGGTPVNLGVGVSNTGGTETRPVNAAVNFYINY